MKSKFLICTYIWLLFLLITPVALAATTLTVKIPGNPKAGKSPADYVTSLYNFGRIAVGAAAFGVIVFAALEYTASAGNTARQEDARDRIKEAIMGIILLFGATILFNLINPDIWPLTNPTIPKPLKSEQAAASSKTAETAPVPKTGVSAPLSQPQSGFGGTKPPQVQ